MILPKSVGNNKYNAWVERVKKQFGLTNEEVSSILGANEGSAESYKQAGILCCFADITKKEKCCAVLEGIQKQFSISDSIISKLSNVEIGTIEKIQKSEFDNVTYEELFNLAITLQVLTTLLN